MSLHYFESQTISKYVKCMSMALKKTNTMEKTKQGDGEHKEVGLGVGLRSCFFPFFFTTVMIESLTEKYYLHKPLKWVRDLAKGVPRRAERRKGRGRK